MGGETSAYATLGLEPGADTAAIDAAYRRLIKLHHPDRSGGDPARAAEINRAYSELRRGNGPSADPQPRHDGIAEALYARRADRAARPAPRPRRRSPWLIVAVAVAILLYVNRERVSDQYLDLRDQLWDPWSPVVRSAPGSAPVRGNAALDGDLDANAIAASIAQARDSVVAGEGAAAERSRACHRQLRQAPSRSQLDRCAAFDYAAGLLQNRDLLRDEGPFSATAVTSRQMAAASLISNDFLEIEARLDRIRARVEVALAPPPAPVVISNLADLPS